MATFVCRICKALVPRTQRNAHYNAHVSVGDARRIGTLIQATKDRRIFVRDIPEEK